MQVRAQIRIKTAALEKKQECVSLVRHLSLSQWEHKHMQVSASTLLGSSLWEEEILYLEHFILNNYSLLKDNPDQV